MTGPETSGAQGGARYENRDVDAGSLLRTFFAIVLVTLIVLVLLWRLYFFFVAGEAARQPPPPILKPDSSVHAPPPPRLQTRPAEDLRARRAREDAHLGSYGWMDREQGRVRIPIEEAMRLIAERGIEASAPPGPPPDSLPAEPGKDAGGTR